MNLEMRLSYRCNRCELSGCKFTVIIPCNMQRQSESTLTHCVVMGRLSTHHNSCVNKQKITKTELEPKFYCRSRISGHLFPLFSLCCVTLQETTATCPWEENPASLRYPLMIFNKRLTLTPLHLFLGNGTVFWALSN